MPDGHHDLSHHGGSREKLEKIKKINRFHMTQFAYFLEKLKSIRELTALLAGADHGAKDLRERVVELAL